MHNPSAGRGPLFAREVAAEAGLKVVIGTGYARDAALPPSVREASTAELADRLVADISSGIDGLQVRAGLIADIEVSRLIRDTERRTLEAAAIAQARTGAALSIRPDIESETLVYDEVLDLAASAGADLTRVAIFGLVPDRATCSCSRPSQREDASWGSTCSARIIGS
jgi:phosphotriesterase-related protein